ncbi:zinc finger protein 878-like [Sabethes cyaneus]|uniref:zinc finger protein 878-like n=1 Tax=Sabethes cyaneus TaxID=53552 RepID=UPI00237E8C19|nr:zinc finger protein 878-like [Sabethes cyaneus]
MGNRRVRMCRLCLSTTVVLRSIFTIFRNHNLVFIIQDYIKLEIKEDDRLPKLICKSCAVKLIRIRENVTLFKESDRKLRDKLHNDAELPDIVNELRQDKKRKYIHREKAFYGNSNNKMHDHAENLSNILIKVEKKDTGLQSVELTSDHLFEFNEIKEEILSSDAEEDIPLTKLKKSINVNVAVADNQENNNLSIATPGCKKEVDKINISRYVNSIADDDNDPNGDDLDNLIDEQNLKSDNVSSEEDANLNNRRRKKQRLISKKKSTRWPRRQAKVFRELVETEETYEEARFDPVVKERKQEDSNEASDDTIHRKKRGRPRVVDKHSKKKTSALNSLQEKQEPFPTLHDYRCYICNSDSLGSRKSMIEHFSVHIDKLPYTCKECVMETVTLTRVRTLNSHMKMHAQPVKCDYCDRRYSNAAGKYYHTQTFHLGGGAPCLVNCEVCGKTCGSQSSLKQHMKYHTTKLKCEKCDMVFNHPNKRRNHERLHDENRGYECVVCKKVLQTIESYDVHLKKHSQERSYQCHLCPKKFNTSCNLILHLKVHAKNDNYKPAKSWVEHYTVLSRNPMHFKCNHCDRYSTDKVNNMISHLQAHFKEYECDQCQHKFATAKQLRAHYTTHTGEKPEKCKYCEKVFSTKNNLRIHLKASHPEWIPQRQQQQPQMSQESRLQTTSHQAQNSIALQSNVYENPSSGGVIFSPQLVAQSNEQQ